MTVDSILGLVSFYSCSEFFMVTCLNNHNSLVNRDFSTLENYSYMCGMWTLDYGKFYYLYINFYFFFMKDAYRKL